MNWDSDPELKALREDFIASFIDRRAELIALGNRLATASTERETLMAELSGVGHKLAGAAESYGFELLTEAGAALDDYFALTKPAALNTSQAKQAIDLLAEMLERSLAMRKDADEFRRDPRFVELTCAAESLVAEANS